MAAGEVVGGAATAAADSLEPADVAAVGVLAVAAAVVALDRACLLRMEID